MLKLNNLHVGYNHLTLLEAVTTHFEAGALHALLGRNGSGKSTLLRLLSGVSQPLAGSVEFNGRPIRELTPEEMARTVAIVSTERIRIPNLKCRDVVALGRAPYTDWMGRLQPEDEAIVERALEMVQMSAYADRPLDRLSDGESQRVLIARALAQQTPILLLDEPTSFLDMPNRYALSRLLKELSREANKCILFSTHELDIALTMADTIALIDTPHLHHLSAEAMAHSGHIERLFSNSTVRFDAQSGRVIVQD